MLNSIVILVTWIGYVASTTSSLNLYSYICLSHDQNLCMGVSPGKDNVPKAVDRERLQAKRRQENVDKDSDWYKMKWHVDYEKGSLQFSENQNICVLKSQQSSEIVLVTCQFEEGLDIWDLEFDGLGASGVIRLKGSDDCITVVQCHEKNHKNCDPSVETYVMLGRDSDEDVFETGAYLKAKPCFDVSGLDVAESQTWTQTLDCIPGCSPHFAGNNYCDEKCDIEECDWDGGDCDTLAPTHSPTSNPTQSPALNPSPAPTLPPTTISPTLSPNLDPTSFPTTLAPSLKPTQSPSPTPTLEPTLTPSQNPSLNPLVRVNTTVAPSVANNVSIVTLAPSLPQQECLDWYQYFFNLQEIEECPWWQWLIVFLTLLLLLCICGSTSCYAIYLYRRDQKRSSVVEDSNSSGDDDDGGDEKEDSKLEEGKNVPDPIIGSEVDSNSNSDSDS
ncbi:MAG: hypothetical protein ACTSUE_24745, partial [Promethearchaeota archaeon]